MGQGSFTPTPSCLQAVSTDGWIGRSHEASSYLNLKCLAQQCNTQLDPMTNFDPPLIQVWF